MKWLAYFFVACLFIAAPVRGHAQTTTSTTTDSDGDGFPDVVELQAGYDPYSSSPVPLPKTIKVSIKDQRLRYYTGEYLVGEIKVSTGVRGWDTPKGAFSVLKKLPAVHYKGENYDYPNTKWNLKFKHGAKGSYYIHGAYWHNKFGRPMSHGCVNVSYKDMGPLYSWTPSGTPVIIE